MSDKPTPESGETSPERFSLATLRKQTVVEILGEPTAPKPPKKKIRRSLSFWLHLYVGCVVVATLTLHGLILSGYFSSSTMIPILWIVSVGAITLGTYLIRHRLTTEGGVIPRRAARTIWLTFFAICIFWPILLWFVVKTRGLPAYINDLSIPILFLFYVMAKTLERARVSEAFPILTTIGCVAACLTTLLTFGFPNQYFLAASWVGIIIILPNLRDLLSWD